MLVLIFATAALAIAGLSKGLVGLGLPPIAMGLLVIIMPAVDAAAIMVVPALLTNIWQGLRGPALGALLSRFWLMLVLTGVATLVFAGALVRFGEAAIAVLGGLLILYGAYGLRSPRIVLPAQTERWAAPVSGVATGVVTAFTGVSSMPSVPFLQSVGLERDAFIQAMGLSFSVSGLGLLAGLGLSGGLAGASVNVIGLATCAAFAGMAVGARLRQRFDEVLFRKLILWVLVALGAYLLIAQAS